MIHPLLQGPPQPPPPMPEAPLPPRDEITVFDEAAVDDNYDGKLAAHQVEGLRKSVFNVAVIVGIAYLGTLVLSLLVWGEQIGQRLLPMVVLFIICTALCFPLLRRIFNLTREIRYNAVIHIDGRIRLVKEIKRSQRFWGSSIQNYAIVMNDITFYVPKGTFEVCRRDMNYRLYYTPITREFVNIHSL